MLPKLALLGTLGTSELVYNKPLERVASFFIITFPLNSIFWLAIIIYFSDEIVVAYIEPNSLVGIFVGIFGGGSKYEPIIFK